MVADLGLYWFVHSRFDEVLFWLPRALELSPSEPTVERAKVLYVLGMCYAANNRRKEAEAVARELAGVAEVLDDGERAGNALFIWHQSAFHVGDLEEARRLVEEQARLLRSADHP